jgi:RNA polymerase sigma factor (sigma-70 family)
LRPDRVKKAAEALDLTAEEAADLELPSSSPGSDPPIVVRLFKTHARRVQRFLSFRLRDSEDGHEATQEVFLRLWRHEQAGTLRAKATNYMYSATQSIAADVERHRARHPAEQHSDDDLDTFATAAPDQDDVIYWRRAMARFVDILKTLPETTRQVLMLYHLKEMDYDEIAAELGISHRTVERHMARAVSHCRARMRDYL